MSPTASLGQLATKSVSVASIKSGTKKDAVSGDTVTADLEIVSQQGISIAPSAGESVTMSGDTRVGGSMEIGGDLSLTDKVTFTTVSYDSVDNGAIQSLNNRLVLGGEKTGAVGSETIGDVVVYGSTLVTESQTGQTSLIVRGSGDKELSFKVLDAVAHTSSQDGKNTTRAIVSTDAGVDLELAASNQSKLLLSADSTGSSVRVGSASTIDFHPGSVAGAAATNSLQMTTLKLIEGAQSSDPGTPVIRTQTSVVGGTASDLLLAGNGSGTHMLRVSTEGSGATLAAKLGTTQGDLVLDSQSGKIRMNDYVFYQGTVSRYGTDFANTMIQFAPHGITDNYLGVTLDNSDGMALFNGTYDASAKNIKVTTQKGDLELNAASGIVKANQYTFSSVDGTISNATQDLKFSAKGSSSHFEVKKHTIGAKNHVKLSTTNSSDLYLASSSGTVYVNDLQIVGGVIKHPSAPINLAGKNHSEYVQITTTGGQTPAPLVTTSAGNLNLTAATGIVKIEDLSFEDSSITSKATDMDLYGSEAAKTATRAVRISTTSDGFPQVTTSTGPLILTSADTNKTVSVNDLSFSSSSISSASAINFKPNLSDVANIASAPSIRFSKEAGGALVIDNTHADATTSALKLKSSANQVLINEKLTISETASVVSLTSTEAIHVTGPNKVTVQSLEMDDTGTIKAVGKNLTLQSGAASTPKVEVNDDLVLKTGKLTSPASVPLTIAAGNSEVCFGSASSGIKIEGQTISSRNNNGILLSSKAQAQSIKIFHNNDNEPMVTTSSGDLNLTSATKNVYISDSTGSVVASGLTFANTRIHGSDNAVILSRKNDSSGLKVDLDGTNAKLTTTAGPLVLTSADSNKSVEVSGVTVKTSGENGVISSTAAGSTLKLAPHSTVSPLEITTGGSAQSDLKLTTVNDFYIESKTAKKIFVKASDALELQSTTADVKVKALSGVNIQPGSSGTQLQVTTKTIGVAPAAVQAIELTTSAGNLNIGSATSKVFFPGVEIDGSNAAYSGILKGTVANKPLKISATVGHVEVEDLKLHSDGKVASKTNKLTLESFTTSQDAASASTRNIKVMSNLELAAGTKLTNTSGNLEITAANKIVNIDGLAINTSDANTVTLKTTSASRDIALQPKNNSNGGIVISSTTIDSQPAAKITTTTGAALEINGANNQVRIGDGSSTDSKVYLANSKVCVHAQKTLHNGGSAAVVSSTTGDLNLAGATASDYVTIDGAGIKTNKIESGANNLVLKPGTNKAVIVDGDLDVTGAINQIDVDQLNVEDKVVRVAHTVDGTPLAADGLANDGAGLEIGGDATYDRCLKWYNTGGTKTHTAALEKDLPYWELKGGNLQVTRDIAPAEHKKPLSDGSFANAHADPSSATPLSVSFSFRINNKEQLEVVKVAGHLPGGTHQTSLNQVCAIFETGVAAAAGSPAPGALATTPTAPDGLEGAFNASDVDTTKLPDLTKFHYVGNYSITWFAGMSNATFSVAIYEMIDPPSGSLDFALGFYYPWSGASSGEYKPFRKESYNNYSADLQMTGESVSVRKEDSMMHNGNFIVEHMVGDMMMGTTSTLFKFSDPHFGADPQPTINVGAAVSS